MIARSLEELDQIREECKSMVTKRATASGFAAIVPIPGTDIAADIAMLMQLLPSINRSFSLSKEQMEELDDQTKFLVLQIAKQIGSVFVGQLITKELILQVLKSIAGRVATKQIIKYIPFVGQAAAAAISFTAMKYVGNSHVDECYEVIKKVLERRSDQYSEDEVASTNFEGSKREEYEFTSKQEILESLKILKELLDTGIIDEEEFQQKKKEILSKL